MNTAGLRRRGYSKKKGPKLLVEYTHTANDVMIPVSYDSDTGYIEVNSIPDSFGLSTDSYTGVRVHVLDIEANPGRIPIKRRSDTVQVKKIDATHIVLEDLGDGINNNSSVSASRTYDLDKFRFEVLNDQTVELLDREQVLGKTLLIEFTESGSLINKNTSCMNFPTLYSGITYTGSTYEQGYCLTSFSMIVTINNDGTFDSGQIQYIHGKKYNNRGVASTINRSNLEMVATAWESVFSKFSIKSNWYNGTNCKIYQI